MKFLGLRLLKYHPMIAYVIDPLSSLIFGHSTELSSLVLTSETPRSNGLPWEWARVCAYKHGPRKRSVGWVFSFITSSFKLYLA